MLKYDTLAQHYMERRKNKAIFDYNRDIEVPALIKMLGNVRNKVILDIGCGFGDHAEKLSKQKYKKLIGLDISKKLIKLANEKKLPHTTFYVRDMDRKLNYKGSYFDVVYAALSIDYTKNVCKLFKEINHVLKRGGIFCFSTGHPIFNMLNQNKHHIIGVKKMSNGKRLIFGDYFDESPKLHDLGRLGKVRFSNLTYETLIKAGLDNGFGLIDYKDAKPLAISKKYNLEKYRVTSALPTFILFKFRKK